MNMVVETVLWKTKNASLTELYVSLKNILELSHWYNNLPSSELGVELCN